MRKLIVYLAVTISISALIAQSTAIELKWEKYFTADENKVIGIWAHGERASNIRLLKDLKYKWGFNFIVSIPTDNPPWLQNVMEAGFDSNHVMMQIQPTGELTYDKIVNYPRVWGYYIDEPADRGYSESSMAAARNAVQTYSPNSKFVISGYKRNDLFKHYANNYSDLVYFSSYKHWWKIFGIWTSCCPVDTDQRPDWSNMQGLFSGKFNATWIGAHQDMSEYPNLLGHAKNLGLNGVWFYQVEEPDHDFGNTLLFCEAAAANGFMTTEYQQVRYKYSDGQLVSRQFVGPMYSGPPNSFNHNELIFENTIVNNYRIDDYYAEDLIRAGGGFTFTLPAGNTASFNSSGTIELKPGFHAEYGSEFRAYIEQPE